MARARANVLGKSRRRGTARASKLVQYLELRANRALHAVNFSLVAWNVARPLKHGDTPRVDGAGLVAQCHAQATRIGVA